MKSVLNVYTPDLISMRRPALTALETPVVTKPFKHFQLPQGYRIKSRTPMGGIYPSETDGIRSADHGEAGCKADRIHHWVDKALLFTGAVYVENLYMSRGF
jgi:hypothetical protein